MAAPQETGQHLRTAPALRCIAVPIGALLFIALIDIPALIALQVDTPRNVVEMVLGLTGAWLVLWTLPFTLVEWLLMTLLGSRPPLGRSFAAACLSCAPLFTVGVLPVLGLLVALPWMFAARAALMRSFSGAPGLEIGISIVAPVLLLGAWLFALRLDVIFAF